MKSSCNWNRRDLLLLRRRRCSWCLLSLTHSTQHTLSIAAVRAHDRNKSYTEQCVCHLYQRRWWCVLSPSLLSLFSPRLSLSLSRVRCRLFSPCSAFYPGKRPAQRFAIVRRHKTIRWSLSIYLRCMHRGTRAHDRRGENVEINWRIEITTWSFVSRCQLIKDNCT